MTKKLVNRQKQEEMDKAIRERKKAIKRLARSKFKTSTGKIMSVLAEQNKKQTYCFALLKIDM